MTGRNAALGFALTLVLAGGCAPQSVSSPVVPAPSSGTAAAPQGCTEAAETIQEGKASWYGNFHKGEKTASGEKFDPNARTAAHRTLPLGTPIRVTNLENGRETTLIVNDRGPVKKGRVLDVSQKGAQDLGFVSDGTAPVRIKRVGPCAPQIEAAK